MADEEAEINNNDTYDGRQSVRQELRLDGARRQLTDDDEGTKTFHMAPRQDELGWPDGFNGRDHWPVYDPFTGLRTAAVLGGLMLLMLVYLLYKTRCGGRVGRRRWTSKDRLFVERYKRKVQEKYSLEGSTRRRRDTSKPVFSRNVDASATDRQKTVISASQRRRASFNTVVSRPKTVVVSFQRSRKTIVCSSKRRRGSQADADRRRRHRQHSVNDALTSLDVRLPVRFGKDAARPARASVAGPSAPVHSSSAPAPGGTNAVEKTPPPPVAVYVEDRSVTDQSVRHPPPLSSQQQQTRFIELGVLPQKTLRGAAGVGHGANSSDRLRRLGRRSRSLENVHRLAGADDRRSYA